MDRRDFMKSSAMTAAGISLFPAGCASEFVAPPPPLFKVSLAQWSLHRALFANEMTNLEFPVIAREAFGINGVEYVNAFMKEGGQRPSIHSRVKRNLRC